MPSRPPRLLAVVLGPRITSAGEKNGVSSRGELTPTELRQDPLPELESPYRHDLARFVRVARVNEARRSVGIADAVLGTPGNVDAPVVVIFVIAFCVIIWLVWRERG